MFKSLQSTKSLKYITSTIILKIVMAITGLLLVLFLFGHAAGNLQYFLGPEAYNTYATFLQEGIGELLWFMRGGLLLCVILHIISAIYLRVYNNAAKPQGYQVKNYVKTKLTARTMMWTGLLLATGLTFHLLHFTGGVVEANEGHQYTELAPVGTFVMEAGNCSNAADCQHNKSLGTTPCAANCSTPCETGKPCMDAALNTSVTVHKPQTTQVGCGGDCPPGGEMCAACKANPEMCSKNVATTECPTGKCPTIDECKTCAALSFFQINVTDHIVGTCPETGKKLTSYEPTMPGAVIRPRNDAYAMVTAEFSNVWMVLVYVLFVAAVGFHLSHAIESGFQTLGIQGPKFTPFIRIASICLSVLLVLLMIILPLSVLVKSLCGSFFGGC